MRANVGVLKGIARNKVIRKWESKQDESLDIIKAREKLQKKQGKLADEIYKLKKQLMKR